MGTDNKRYERRMGWILIWVGILVVTVSGSAMADTQQVDHMNHAKELLGKSYRKIVLDRVGNVDHFEAWLEVQVADSLQGKWKRRSHEVARAIMEESSKYKFDPVFLMAVIQNESSFNPTIRGTSGEIGLMQVLPTTAQWIAKRNGLQWEGEKTLLDPVKNIRIGSAYMAFLRERTAAQGGLYLAAYNMGLKNVYRALKKDVHPKDYAIRVMQRYIKFYGKMPAAASREDRMIASIR